MIDDDPMRRSLREAASPALAEGAAERIAAGAWERAARLRAVRGPRLRVLRRASWAAAAAVLVAGTLLAWRGTDAAFAVEGDPVMIRRGGGWVATRDVPADVSVRVPDGARVLRTKRGDVFRPRPGSVFRCVEELSAARPQVLVVFSEGGGDVDGAGVVVSMRDEVVVEPDPSAATLRLSFAFDGAGGAPRFCVDEGGAVARSPASGERLVLRAAQGAALLPISFHGSTTPRFARLAPWSTDAASQIVRGRVSVIDADFGPVDGITLVGGTQTSGLLAFDVPSGAVADALRCVNGASVFQAMISVRAVAASGSPTRYVYEKDATRVEVDVDGCGAVVVKDGAGVRSFADLAAFRREAPGAAALFGGAIDR